MRIKLLVVFLLTFLYAEGRDDFDDMKKFEEWRCRHRPTGCHSVHGQPTTDEKAPLSSGMDERQKARALAAKMLLDFTGFESMRQRTIKSEGRPRVDHRLESIWLRIRRRRRNREVRRSMRSSDSDEDDYYQYLLWKKYRREKSKRRGFGSTYDPSSEFTRYHQRYSRPYPSYYTSPYYSYSYPSYGYASPYQYNGGYGGYNGGFGYNDGYGGGLFSIGGSRQFGISTPIGGFGYSSGFGIGIG